MSVRSPIAGELVGAFNFGVCLAEGVGVERDDRRALLWLRRAADGIVNAQYWYGRMLVEGRGLDPDPAEGQRWIARAAERGMADAQALYGEMLVSGRGGTRDHALALDMFGRAAASGHVGAMFSTAALRGGGPARGRGSGQQAAGCGQHPAPGRPRRERAAHRASTSVLFSSST